MHDMTRVSRPKNSFDGPRWLLVAPKIFPCPTLDDCTLCSLGLGRGEPEPSLLDRTLWSRLLPELFGLSLVESDGGDEIM